MEAQFADRPGVCPCMLQPIMTPVLCKAQGPSTRGGTHLLLLEVVISLIPTATEDLVSKQEGGSMWPG